MHKQTNNVAADANPYPLAAEMLAACQSLVESELERLVSWPALEEDAVKRAMRYSLTAGGKRPSRWNSAACAAAIPSRPCPWPAAWK